MRMRRVATLAIVRMAMAVMVCGALVMPERHALADGYSQRPLQWHRDGDQGHEQELG
jgi:hypothetical protein